MQGKKGNLKMSQGTQNKEKMRSSMKKQMSAKIDGKRLDKQKRKSEYNIRKQRKQRNDWE